VFPHSVVSYEPLRSSRQVKCGQARAARHPFPSRFAKLLSQMAQEGKTPVAGPRFIRHREGRHFGRRADSRPASIAGDLGRCRESALYAFRKDWFYGDGIARYTISGPRHS
jgi:hypothetical protein